MRWFEEWKKALPDGTACGREDIFFSAEFEALQGEVNKNDALQPDQRTDWGLVLEMATSLLSSTVKDIWVFCYGSRAVYEQSGLSGLSSALEVTADYLGKYWDELYPPAGRAARRAAPFLWLITKLEILMPANAFPVEKDEAYGAFREVLNNLQAVLDSHMGENAPSFRNILRAIPEKKKQPPAPESRPAPSSPLPSSLPPVETPRVLAGLDGDGRVPDSILPQLLRATTEQAQQLAVHYLSRDIRDWRVYLLHRTALWATVIQLPPANSDNVTPLRMVLPRDKALAYAAAMDNKQYESILPQLERSAGKAPFWFDGHYMVVRCLEALGGREARNIVCTILRSFLMRYPELPGYKFHDGTPFASPSTLQWLEELRHETPSAEKRKQEDDADADDEAQVRRNDMLLSQAVAISREQSFEEGLASLGPSPSGKNRRAILHGILLARYCIRAGKPKAGKELLVELYNRLEAWDMLDWEPELAAHIVSLLINVGGDKGQPGMRRRLYSLQAETAIRYAD